MKVRINESLDDFSQIRQKGFYYVDKTMILKEYLEDSFRSAILFARPRRFGKTLTMTMFRDFLDIQQDSREIFKGLKIMEYPDVVNTYMNQYPVVFISLKEVFGTNFDAVFKNFQIAVSRTCNDLKKVLDSDLSDPVDREVFVRLRRKESGQEETEQSLDILCQMLKEHYGKSVFVIIDEYDVPIAKALGTTHYDCVQDMIEHMLSYVCKTNKNVEAVILSGCLYTVKNSTYSGVNNIVPRTVLSPTFASSIGFTDEDVRKILNDTGMPEQYDTVTEWYDGYLFGSEKMF
ncbi:MAG: AAA family ATPase, partial [Clostridia bacterium]|nr:AAA family ATPase [Clostridia bacterium]